MNRQTARVAFVAAFGGFLLGGAASAQQVEVCKLVSKDAVKRHVPWIAALDAFPVEEEAIGTSGSSCNYPTVLVQVIPFNPGSITALRNAGPLETISGLGDEAYFRNNNDTYAEVMVRVGSRMLTLQADGEGRIDTVKPQVIELAKLYVAALR